jgi:uncharacterized protein YdaU (DUF1376 family)
MVNKKDFEYSNEELAEIARNNPDFHSPAFQLYVNDFLGSNKITMMKPEGLAGYTILLFASWNEKDCGLPTDVDALVKLSKLFPNVFDEVKNSILENFFEYKGRYYNRRLLLERKKQINMRNQRTGAIRKRYEKPTGEKFPVNEDVNEIEDNNKKEGRFYKSIPLKFKDNEKFWIAWKNWVDHNEARFTTITPAQAKLQLIYLEQHESPIELLEQALANDWKGIIYKDNSKNKSMDKQEITYDEFCKLPIDGQKKYKKNKDKNIWELINA